MLTYAGLAAEESELAAVSSLPDFTDFPNSWTWVGANSQEMMGANSQQMTSGSGTPSSIRLATCILDRYATANP